MIGVDVLAEQGDFAHPVAGQRTGLGEDLGDRPRILRATRIGHHTEAAKLIATFLDRQKGHRPAAAVNRRQMIEFNVARKIGVDQAGPFGCGPAARGAAAWVGLGDQLGQAVIGLRAENHVDIGCAGDDFITLGLRDTAGDGDHHRRVGAGAGGFLVAQTTQLGKHLLGGFLADVTGVQDHQVGLVRGRAKGIVQGR